jgi:Predicted pPIWI-associating nuclease
MIQIKEKLKAVARAVEDFELSEAPAWSDLDELSTHTTLDDVEVDTSGIVIEGNAFRGVANVYVTLQFGRDDNEGFHESDSFLATFAGRFEDGEPVVETFDIDTSSRFEE